MPIIALPWLHTYNNSSEKNVLTTLGNIEKEQHGETKVTGAFYKDSSVCYLSRRQSPSTCKMQSHMVKPVVHHIDISEGLIQAYNILKAGMQRTH